MPTYKGVEVWIEDAGYRKLNHREVYIDLVDDHTVTVKIEMSRNELFTIHCASPTSIFCDVFVITASLSRNRAARFHLDENLAVSNNASASSVNHLEGEYKDHGLRTSKRQSKLGKLGTVEVEIRRIGEIIKGEPREEYGIDGGEDSEVATEFSMMDDFDQPPWLIFHFDIGVKESLPAVLAPAAEHIRRHVPRRMAKSQCHATSGSSPRSSSTEVSSNTTYREAGSQCLHNLKKRRRVPDDRDGAASVGESLKGTNSDRLYEEYQKEEAEEQRLLQKLQAQVQLKKTRNMELRRLLGETA